MKEIIMYILFIIACFVIITLCNNNMDNICQKAHGQIVTHTTGYGHKCIYPAKQDNYQNGANGHFATGRFKRPYKFW